MILNIPTTGLADGSVKVMRYSLNAEDIPVIQQMLSRGIYSNPVRAVIQELGSNARDAHVEAGCADFPIRISLPCVDSPSLVIQDYGIGINEDRMIRVFGKIAASTKRGDSAQLGGFGLGCKTGFAVSDSFHINTVAVDLDGVKRRRLWMHFKENGINSYAQLSNAVVDDEAQTGTTISIPIADCLEKINDFASEAFSIFHYWDVKPSIENAPEGFKWESYDTSYNGNGWTLERKSDGSKTPVVTVVVGGIPYNLDQTQLIRLGLSYTGIYRLTFRFEVGEIVVLPTRENIDYESSAAALTSRFRLYEEEIERCINNQGNDQLFPTLELAESLGLAKISYGDSVIDIADTKPFYFGYHSHFCRLYELTVVAGKVKREKTPKAEFKNCYYHIGSWPKQERLSYAMNLEERDYVVLFSSRREYDVFCTNHQLFPLAAKPLPPLPKGHKTVPNRTSGRVSVFDVHGCETATVELSKLAGVYAMMSGSSLVLRNGSTISRVRMAKVYGLRKSQLAHVDLSKLIHYQDALEAKNKRASLRAKASRSHAQRKHGISIRFSSRQDAVMARRILTLPAFRNVRKKLLACISDTSKHVDYSISSGSLIGLAYRGSLPSFLKTECKLRDLEKYTAILKKLKPNNITWKTLKTDLFK